MKILIVGDSEANYLAKCHEAFRDGLRTVADVRSFGQGYERYRSELQTYQEVIQHTFGVEAPDLIIPAYEFKDGSLVLPYRGLEQVAIPKVVLLGDFWAISAEHRKAFVTALKNQGVFAVMCYFPQALQYFADCVPDIHFICVPPCFDPKLFKDHSQEKLYDVGFLAAGTVDYNDFYPERYAIHKTLIAEQNIRYLWAEHPGWQRHSDDVPLVGANFSKAINSCRIFITTAGILKHPNPKYVEILASKTALFAETPVDHGLFGLEDGVNYVSLTPENALEKITYYLQQPAELDRIQENGFQLALEKHNHIKRAQEFISSIKELLGYDISDQGTTMTLNEALGIPTELVEDNNYPQQIAIPPELGQLPMSSAPQYTLYRLVRYLKPKRILEIGTQTGASAVAVALAMRDNGTAVDVTCIDPFLPCGDNDGQSTLDLFFQNIHKAGFLGNGIKLQIALSEQVLPELTGKYDFIIIDGSHHYEHVLYDFDTSIGLCETGGHLWLHDYVYYESVRTACHQTLEKHNLVSAANHIQTNDRGDLCGWAIVRNLSNSFGEKINSLPELKLHIGCGFDPKADYINIDASADSAADLVCNYLDIDQVFAPESLSEILSVHSINYITLWESRAFFQKACALLKPGGQLIIETVNIKNAAEKMLENIGGEFSEYLEGMRGLYGFGLDHLKNQKYHQAPSTGWSVWHLALELQAAGFELIHDEPPQAHSAWRDLRVIAQKKKCLNKDKPNCKEVVQTTDADSVKRGKLVFLYDSNLGHVTMHVRGLLFKDPLEKLGWDLEFIDTYSDPAHIIVERCRSADLVYLLKVASLDLVSSLKREISAKIIFDLTDALWKPYHREYGWHDLESILSISDALFSENEYIVNYGKRFNQNVYSIPACARIELFDQTAARVSKSQTGLIRIGWVGSRGTVQALQGLEDVCRKISNECQNVEFRFVGVSRSQLPSFMDIRYSCLENYDEQKMIEEILQMDIGIFPPPLDIEDYEIRGALKGMLYMSGGVPALFLNKGDCLNFVDNWRNGVLVESAADWHSCLVKLIESKELRQAIGEAGKQTMREKHSLERVTTELDRALLQVFSAL